MSVAKSFYCDEEWKAICKAITLTFAYYAREIAFDQVKLHTEDLAAAKLPYESVIKAYSDYRMDGRNTFPPLPVHIKNMIAPSVDADGAAKELAARIVAAIQKYGYTFEEGAEKWLGEDAWYIVRQHGGWRTLCADMGVNLDTQTFIAQSRDLLRARMLTAPAIMKRVRVHLADQKLAMLAAPRGVVAELGREERLAIDAPAEPVDPEELKKQKARFESIGAKLGLGAETLALITGNETPATRGEGDS